MMTSHSLFRSVSDNQPKVVTFEEVMNEIRSIKYKSQIEKIRSMQEGMERDNLKKSLPAFTPSGVFEERRKLPNLKTYTGVISLDFDKVHKSKLETAQSKLKEDEYVLGFFVSPSGNGLKVFVQTDAVASNHVLGFKNVKKYFEDLLGIKVDESCKDITRLCFLSYDQNAYHNAHAKLFELFDPLIVQTWERACQKHPNKEGSRNNLVFHFAVSCEAIGVEEYACSEYARLRSTLSFSEIMSAVRSAYSGQYRSSVPKPTRKSGKYAALEEFLGQQYKVRFNVITNKPEIFKEGHFQSLTDVIFNDILRSASENHIPITEASLKVVLYSGFATRYNPYEEYLHNLPEWDGYDYIQELVDKVPFRHPSRAYFYLTRWLTGLVASALNDEVVNQHMLVLVGAQGIGKTTFFNSLLPSELKPYIFHGIIRPEDKDTIALLSDQLLIVVDELDTMRHYQLHQMKEVLTKPQITLRRPYARTSENLPRRASFAASVNNTDFLVDPTGNRRYLCLFVDEVIPYELNIDIDQLFSQAYTFFKDGEPYWFNNDEITDIEEANRAFIEPSAEEELLLETFRPPHEDEEYEKLSATEIAIKIAQKYNLTTGKLRSETMGKMLVRNGFPSIMVKGAKKYKVAEVGGGRSFPAKNICVQ